MATQKLTLRKPETKSRRLFVLLRPSLYNDVKRIATANGISVNDTVSQMLEAYVALYDSESLPTSEEESSGGPCV